MAVDLAAIATIAKELTDAGWTASEGFGYVTATYQHDESSIPEIRVADDGSTPTIRELSGGGGYRSVALTPYVFDALAVIKRHLES